MLKIIDEDADSFAQRADMYYMKRPQLINMVEDLYRSHRSLAENFYAVKLAESSRTFGQKRQLEETLPTEYSFTSKLNKSSSVTSFTDTYEDDFLYDSDRFSTESEIDDPEVDDPIETEILNEVLSGTNEVMKLKEEIESLRKENEMKRDELMRKDEEKREVIRQLSFALEMAKEDNLMLKKSLAAKSSNPTSKKWNFPELCKVFFI